MNIEYLMWGKDFLEIAMKFLKHEKVPLGETVGIVNLEAPIVLFRRRAIGTRAGVILNIQYPTQNIQYPMISTWMFRDGYWPLDILLLRFVATQSDRNKAGGYFEYSISNTE